MKKLSAWARARGHRRKTVAEATKEEAADWSANGQPFWPSPPRPGPSMQQHFHTRSSNDGSASNRTGSNARIKPVLIGVSRPSDTPRPDTAGSLQSAVNWAADQVAHSSPQKSHSRTQSARHIDIFSVSKPSLAFPAYNEDVASRNSNNQYVPTSPFQEDVAARNAAPPLRAATDQSKKQGPNFAESHTGVALAEYPEQEGGSDEGTPTPGKAEDVAREAAATGAEKPTAATGAETPTAATGAEKPTAGLETSTSEPDTEIVPNGVVPVPHPDSQPQQPTSSLDAPKEENHGGGSDETPSSRILLLNKTINIAAAKTVAVNQEPQPEARQHEEVDALPVGQSSAIEAPSTAERAALLWSNTSMQQTSTIHKRAAIDATADENSDVESSDGPDSFTSASPGFGDVDQEPDSKTPVSILTGAGEQSSNQMHYGGTSNVTPRTATWVEEAEQEELSESSDTPKQHRSQSSFSAISTLVSLLPVAEQDKGSSSPEPNMLAPGEANRRPTLNKLYTVAETEAGVAKEARRQPFTAPLVDRVVIPPLSPISLSESTSPESSQSTPTQVKPPSESQWSSALTDSSSPYGIRTRDFALDPRKQDEHALPKQSGGEPGTGSVKTSPAKASKGRALANGRRQVPVTPVKSKASRPVSAFNEEAFQRKQEQARAALIKLQHSLNEDFDNPTPQTMWTQPQTNGVNRYSNSSSSNDGRPHAPPPTYSLGQVLGHHRPARSGVNRTYHPREPSLPRSSLSISEPPTSPRSISSFASSARPLHRHSPMHSLQENTARVPARRRGDTNPTISEMRRLVYEMTQPKLGQDRTYEPSLVSFSHSPEEQQPSYLHQQQQPSYRHQQQQPSYRHQQQQYQPPYPFTFEPYDEDAAPSPVIRSYSASPTRSRNRTKFTNHKKGHANARSSVSLHSIPPHMIPDRGSSMRDLSVRDDAGADNGV
ncbi:hypothetical protein DV735_g100, partial [Chaetothyriales sp. CBS 134920]